MEPVRIAAGAAGRVWDGARPGSVPGPPPGDGRCGSTSGVLVLDLVLVVAVVALFALVGAVATGVEAL